MKIQLAGFAAVATAAAVGLAPIAAADGDLMYRVGVGIALSPVSQQNAVRKAENYLDYTAFSRQGLIDQLEYDGFTPAQAAYGTTAAGL